MNITEVKAKQVEISLNNCKLGIETSRITKLGKKHFDAETQAKLFNIDVLERLINYAENNNIKPTARNYDDESVDISSLSSERVIKGVSKGDFVIDGFLVKGKETDKVKGLYTEITLELSGIQNSQDFTDLEFITPASNSYNFQEL